MILSIDMDNVLCAHQEYVIDTYNTKYNTKYTIDDFKDYDITNVLDFESSSKMKDIYSDPKIYNHITPIKGAVNALQKLVNSGHQIYIVTDAIPITFDNKIKWIKRYFPFINEDHIVSMKHKWLFRCDVMVDDNMENLITGHHYERVCVNYPWNNNVHDEAYNIHRCYSWNDILSAINKINEELVSI